MLGFWKKRHEEEEEQEQQQEQPVQIRPKQEDLKKTLTNINSLLLYMTGLEYVSEMVFIANDQSTTITSVAESSGQLAAATEDISNNVQDSSASMQQTTADTGESLVKINETFFVIGQNIEDMNRANQIMEEVSGEMEKINALVNVIKDVSSQTNLLSLNASIEAARAGESGRGFSVVANEIKKLAENTQEQVAVIQGIVGDLGEKITQATAEIDKVVKSFSESSESIRSATADISKINDTLNSVNDNFASISANVEEQSATTNEMSGHLQKVNNQSAELLGHIGNTGKAFYEISQKLFDIRALSINDAGELDAQTMVELIKADHLMWKWRVYNMILGYVHLEEAAVGDHRGCRLGKWVTTLDTTDPAVAELINRMEKPHAGVHQTARKAIHEYNSGNTEGAKKLLNELNEYSAEVVKLIGELGKVLK